MPNNLYMQKGLSANDCGEPFKSDAAVLIDAHTKRLPHLKDAAVSSTLGCGREDSNLHGGLAHTDLNRARLPIPPRPHIGHCLPQHFVCGDKIDLTMVS